MQVPVPLHHVVRTDEPSDLRSASDEGRREPRGRVVLPSRGAPVEEDPHADPAPRGAREVGRDRLAREGVPAELEARAGGSEEREERSHAVVGREEGSDGPRRLERRRLERGLAEPVVPEAVPVCRASDVRIDPSILETGQHLSPTRGPRGRTRPAGARVPGLPVYARVEDAARRIEEEDLVPRVREARPAALHRLRISPVVREVRGLEGVLAVARRVP